MRTHRWYVRAMTAGVLLIILAFAAVSAAGCGDEADAATGPLELTKADDGKTFAVKVGDAVTVKLAGNPTTGFAWAAALDDASAALLKEQGEPDYTQDATDEEVVGAGGTYTFTFTAAAAGEATIELAYARPWESVQPEETFTAVITIE